MTAIRKHIRNTIAGALLLSGTALAGDAASAAAAPVAATIPAHARLPRTNSGPTNWSTDAYQYDASGNIIAIGQQSFIYDTTNRLVSATTAMPVDGQADAMQTETFNYDVYGNMTDRTVDSLTTTSAIDATTNRLTAFSAQYDTAGNLTHMQPPGSARTYDYDYDSFNMLRDMRSPTSNPAQPYWVIYIYTADDQRLWTYNVSGNVSHWTIRDLGGNVLRDFKNDGNAPAASQWSLSRDYIYREGALLAAVNPTGSEHFTLDHLGTPRLITSATGVRIGQHTYRAFGNERSNLGVQEDDPRKFTGHERDHDPAGESVAELDYMHARYYNAALGRFSSSDRAEGDAATPRSWNRYAYVEDNPMNFTDPDGLLLHEVWNAFKRGLIGDITVHAYTDDYLRTLFSGRHVGADVNTRANRREGARILPMSRLLDAELDAWSKTWNQGIGSVAPTNRFELIMMVFLDVKIPNSRFLTTSFKQACRALRVSEEAGSMAVHAAKESVGRGGADNVIFNKKTGEIIARETGEILGNLRDFLFK
jgi:RHS repeat-associated protein